MSSDGVCLQPDPMVVIDLGALHWLNKQSGALLDLACDLLQQGKIGIPTNVWADFQKMSAGIGNFARLKASITVKIRNHDSQGDAVAIILGQRNTPILLSYKLDSDYAVLGVSLVDGCAILTTDKNRQKYDQLTESEIFVVEDLEAIVGKI